MYLDSCAWFYIFFIHAFKAKQCTSLVISPNSKVYCLILKEFILGSKLTRTKHKTAIKKKADYYKSLWGILI